VENMVWCGNKEREMKSLIEDEAGIQKGVEWCVLAMEKKIESFRFETEKNKLKKVGDWDWICEVGEQGDEDPLSGFEL
jgi:hypothetical protein